MAFGNIAGASRCNQKQPSARLLFLVYVNKHKHGMLHCRHTLAVVRESSYLHPHESLKSLCCFSLLVCSTAEAEKMGAVGHLELVSMLNYLINVHVTTLL